MTVAGPAAERAEEAAEKAPQPVKRNKIKTGEGRLALMLVAPTVILLALVVGYPIVKGIYQSFQSDPGLDSTTGFFSTSSTHWVGLANYKYWLLQQCPAAGGGTGKCPTGTLGVAVLELARRHALLHRRDGRPRDHHRHVLRAGHEQGVPRPGPDPGRHPGAVGHPDRGHLQAVDRHLRPAGHPEQGARHPHPLDLLAVAGPVRDHHRRHLEDHAVHRVADPGRSAGHLGRHLRVGHGSTAPTPGSGSPRSPCRWSSRRWRSRSSSGPWTCCGCTTCRRS